jgi:hypothetical protein
MSFENTPKQSTDIVTDAPAKKRGRPAGAKNKKPVVKKTIGRPVSNPSRLKADLEVANLQVALLKDALDDSRERHKTEVDGLMAIISYLENTLKEAWKDAASV